MRLRDSTGSEGAVPEYVCRKPQELVGTMDDDDFNFDFEKTLEEQQKRAATAPSSSQIPASAAVPVNQSEGSFKRNFRQVTYLLNNSC